MLFPFLFALSRFKLDFWLAVYHKGDCQLSTAPMWLWYLAFFHGSSLIFHKRVSSDMRQADESILRQCDLSIGCYVLYFEVAVYVCCELIYVWSQLNTQGWFLRCARALSTDCVSLGHFNLSLLKPVRLREHPKQFTASAASHNTGTAKWKFAGVWLGFGKPFSQ